METTHKSAATSGPLSFLQPRDTARAARARGARRMMSRLKLILPIASALGILALILWPVLDPNKLMTRVLKNAPDLVIENLNYTNVDSKNQPYSISAAKATRPSGEKNIYDLDKPQGEITLQDGPWVSVRSRYGRFDKDNNLLWLGGNVQIFHDKGYQFTTDEMQVELNDREAWGEKPVLIQGDFGEIRGIGFHLLNSGNTMIVKGPAKALLNLQHTRPSDKPNTVTK